MHNFYFECVSTQIYYKPVEVRNHAFFVKPKTIPHKYALTEKVFDVVRSVSSKFFIRARRLFQVHERGMFSDPLGYSRM
jgi:hypothetical protein